jgi:hypothetical protein
MALKILYDRFCSNQNKYNFCRKYSKQLYLSNLRQNHRGILPTVLGTKIIIFFELIRKKTKFHFFFTIEAKFRFRNMGHTPRLAAYPSKEGTADSGSINGDAERKHTPSLRDTPLKRGRLTQ